MSANGLKSTRQREVIFETFRRMRGHVSVEQLYDAVRERHPEIGHATVYRTLKLLTKCGLAEEHHFGDGFARYEPGELADHEHHDHLICTQCGQIVEFENHEIERLQAQVAASHGFTVTSHKMELYGICANCRGRGGGPH
ncbi:MAG: transcriptional repressor [Myxococcales bacterium]|nr:transcriptional repressor [Myxococcales bacterium]